MRLELLLAVGAFATLASTAVFLTRISTIISSLVALIAWGIVAWGATNVETVTQCCVTRQSEPAVMWFAIGMVGVMTAAMVFGATEFMDARNISHTDRGLEP